MANLIPLVQQATSLRRIVTVGGGGIEAPLDATDFPGIKVPAQQILGHLCTHVTLGMESRKRHNSAFYV